MNRTVLRKEKKMNMHPSFVDIRNSLAYEFSILRTRALRNALWTKLIGKNKKLALFPEQAPQKSPNRKWIGVTDIPVEEIIGTLGRHSDFDHEFRPLKKNLRDRWVNVYLIHEGDGWPPILVHKLEEDYYVEDGHHRVSVARALGLAFIQAKVWEYPSSSKRPKRGGNMECTEKSSAKQYITATD
jgi:hypothetical protein